MKTDVYMVRAKNSCGICDIDQVEDYLYEDGFERGVSPKACARKLLEDIRYAKRYGDLDGNKHAFATISITQPDGRTKEGKYVNKVLEILKENGQHMTDFKRNPNSGNKICLLII